MPNGTVAKGYPIENAIRGIVNLEDTHFLIDDTTSINDPAGKRVLAFGSDDFCEQEAVRLGVNAYIVCGVGVQEGDPYLYLTNVP